MFPSFFRKKDGLELLELLTRLFSLSLSSDLSRLERTCFLSRLDFRVSVRCCLDERLPLLRLVLEAFTCFFSLGGSGVLSRPLVVVYVVDFLGLLTLDDAFELTERLRLLLALLTLCRDDAPPFDDFEVVLLLALPATLGVLLLTLRDLD